MSRADITARQQQPSFPFLPGRGVPSIMPPNPVTMMMSPEQMRYLQDMCRVEQVMMASQPSAALGTTPQQGPPQLPGRMLPKEMFGASQYRPGVNSWVQGANATFIPQDRLDPRLSLGVAQLNPFQGMMNSQTIVRGDETDLLRSMIRLQEENITNLKRQVGVLASAPPAKRQHLDSSVEQQWHPQNVTSQAAGLLPQTTTTTPIHCSRTSKRRKRHVTSFPVKLLEAITAYYDETMIAWLPDGKSIVVVDPQEFCDKVLSKAFRRGKYSSFVRKLNRWGFSRLISGTGMHCFHHPLFQRNRMDLCELITCPDPNSLETSSSNIDPVIIQNMERPSLQGIEKFFAYINSKETEAGKVPKSTKKEDESEEKSPEEVNMKEAASQTH